MAEAFAPGDVVTLKSGGPKMTVSQAGKDWVAVPTVWCVWFVGTKKFEGTFAPEALQPAG